MQEFGFSPVDVRTYKVQTGNILVIPENNTNTTPVQSQFIESRSMRSTDVNVGLTTVRARMGAGFYSDTFGPLPYSFGSVPPERYALIRLKVL
jgi:hypothetical protein